MKITLHGFVQPSFFTSLKASLFVVRKSMIGGFGFKVEGRGFSNFVGDCMSILLYVFWYSVFSLTDAGIKLDFRFGKFFVHPG